MQRGGRKRAVLEPDEHPASRTSVDTGHDPHLRHAGTAAKAEHSPHAIRSALTIVPVVIFEDSLGIPSHAYHRVLSDGTTLDFARAEDGAITDVQTGSV